MNRKQLEIQLTQLISPFDNPKIEYEQYQTPPRVAANLLHSAWIHGHMESKRVLDMCAGTGILGLGAAILGAEVTLVEIDSDAIEQIITHASFIEEKVEIIEADALLWRPSKKYDTVLLNPPFGIQQTKWKDMRFVEKAAQIASTIYAIHDGSDKNQQSLPNLYRKAKLNIKEAYLEEFPLHSSYPWHSMKRKLHHVLVVYSELE